MIDTKKKQVETMSGRTFDYDKLVLATGSHPFMLPIPGYDLKNVLGL